ncbi:MAG: 4a-hydroxytetrahydrobiopterin dehydratase [Thermogutta sp.]
MENAWQHKKCRPCEGGIPAFTRDQAERALADLSGWTLREDGRAIQKAWLVRDFAEAIRFFQAVGELAEAEDHHPDLHLEKYRQVTIVLRTHAVGELSENDFILAAKIDEIPVALKG